MSNAVHMNVATGGLPGLVKRYRSLSRVDKGIAKLAAFGAVFAPLALAVGCPAGAAFIACAVALVGAGAHAMDRKLGHQPLLGVLLGGPR